MAPLKEIKTGFKKADKDLLHLQQATACEVFAMVCLHLLAMRANSMSETQLD